MRTSRRARSRRSRRARRAGSPPVRAPGAPSGAGRAPVPGRAAAARAPRRGCEADPPSAGRPRRIPPASRRRSSCAGGARGGWRGRDDVRALVGRPRRALLSASASTGRTRLRLRLRRLNLRAAEEGAGTRGRRLVNRSSRRPTRVALPAQYSSSGGRPAQPPGRTSRCGRCRRGGPPPGALARTDEELGHRAGRAPPRPRAGPPGS